MHLSQPGIKLAELEADAYDIGLLALDPMAVGGSDESAIGEQFDAGVGRVLAFFVVHDTDAILALRAVDDVLVFADPTDPIALGWAYMGGVPEADEETAIGRILCDHRLSAAPSSANQR